jgi:aerobic carbon-monoxide dehydrogenase large subunit
VWRASAENEFASPIKPKAGIGGAGLRTQDCPKIQGIGQALMEEARYDSDGQLVTGSFMDYALPRAADVPSFVTEHHPVPAKTNPLGVKGCGEAGCAGALVSVMNAIIDALADYGIRHIDMPATPERVWQAIRAARASA